MELVEVCTLHSVLELNLCTCWENGPLGTAIHLWASGPS